MDNRFNYISNKLLEQEQYVESKLSEDDKRIVNENVDFIVREFNEKYNTIDFLKYGDLNEKKEGDTIDDTISHYKLIAGYPQDVETIDKQTLLFFDHSPEILSNFKKLYVYDLVCVISPETKITKKVSVYVDVINETYSNNLNKIMTRILNLVKIFYNKSSNEYNLPDPMDFGMEEFPRPISDNEQSFKLFLYNNPRKANSKKNGVEYLNKLNKTSMRCFNTSSGTSENNISLSTRTEEIIGLLTHEFLHVISLIPSVGQFLPQIQINIIDSSPNTSINTTEIFINTFATIFHAYLSSKELNKNFTELLKNEIIHSLAQSIRLLKISNPDDTLLQIINATPDSKFIFNQISYMFEYTIGRLFLLLNFNKAFREYDSIINNMLDMNEAYKSENTSNVNVIIYNILSSDLNDENRGLLERGTRIVNDYIASKQSVDNDADTLESSLCGNMIMQYFAHDVMEVEEDKRINTLYGGSNDKYYQKYMKYKNKYLTLKSKFH